MDEMICCAHCGKRKFPHTMVMLSSVYKPSIGVTVCEDCEPLLLRFLRWDDE